MASIGKAEEWPWKTEAAEAETRNDTEFHGKETHHSAPEVILIP